MAVIVAGIGCTTTCEPAAIVALVRQAAEQSGKAPTLLAVPDFKSDQASLIQAARLLGLTLASVDRSALEEAQTRTATQSRAASSATGLASVAEAAALAAAGADAVLLLARITGAGVTCALAGPA